MSGTAKVKPPRNNAEWARNTEKRLNQTEHPTSQRIGDWVLSTYPSTGDLIASNVNGGSIILAGKPVPSDDADAVATQGQPFIKVQREQNQQGNRGSTVLVLWDSLIYQTEEWGFVPTGTDIVIPEDGLYLCTYHLAFLNASNVTNKAVFLINGVVKMAQEYDPHNDTSWYQAMYLAEPFPLNAGDIISCGAFVSGSGTFDFGSPSPDPEARTSMSLLKLAVD